MAEAAAACARVLVDVGAGDGGYVVHRAKSEPAIYAIAIDASADALVAGSWKALRAGLANGAFLVESVERLPPSLAGIADEVTVHFPWGSLLRGLVDAEDAVVAPLAAIVRPGGELRVLLSATERDGLAALDLERVRRHADAFACHGLALLEARRATAVDVAAACSSWAKRLRAPARRPVLLARYRRAG